MTYWAEEAWRRKRERMAIRTREMLAEAGERARDVVARNRLDRLDAIDTAKRSREPQRTQVGGAAGRAVRGDQMPGPGGPIQNEPAERACEASELLTRSQAFGTASPAADGGGVNTAPALPVDPDGTAVATRARDPKFIQDTKASTSAETLSLRLRVARYGLLRVRAEAMAGHLLEVSARGIDSPDLGVRLDAETLGSLGRRVADCGCHLVFRSFATGDVRLFAAQFCQLHLLDPFCALRRMAKMVKAYVPKICDAVERERLQPFLVTLTVLNGDDLAERMSHLQRSNQSLYASRRKSRSFSSRNRSVTAVARGGLYSYEVKRGRNSGTWHPHVHAVWLCDSAPCPFTLSREWERITGDSMIVDVRPFKCVEAGLVTDDATAETILDVVGSDLLEVVKYACKFADMSLEDNLHAYRVLRGARLIGSFGCLRAVDVPLHLTDDIESELADVPYLEFVARYVAGEGRYEVSGRGRFEKQTVAAPF